jgi:hypothetical protein
MSDLYYFGANSPQEVNKAIDEFAERGVLIIEHVFHRGYDVRQAFRYWLKDLAREYENPSLLLHQDPLILTGQYLGLDPAVVSGGNFAQEYSQLAKKYHWQH